MFKSIYKRLISITLMLSILAPIATVYANDIVIGELENEFDIPRPTETPKIMELSTNAEITNLINEETIVNTVNIEKDLENREYDKFEPFEANTVFYLEEKHITSETNELNNIPEGNLTVNGESEVQIDVMNTAGERVDDIYTFNNMGADVYNKKIDGELSVSPVNGNVSYLYNIVSIPGKNGLDLSLSLEHNSFRSMPIVTECDKESARDNPMEPKYYSDYNADMGSGWEFFGIKRMDSSGHYVTTRDGRTFNYTSDPYDDVEYSSRVLRYTDGMLETISSTGYLLSVEDKYGNTITYLYDDNDNLTAVSDENGNVITITYSDGYIEITKPDNNKLRLIISELTVQNIGNDYGYSKTMPVNVISSIYDCTMGETLAYFTYDVQEFIYTSYTSSGIWIEDSGVFVVITEYNSPYSGIQKIDYTELALGTRPVSITSVNRLSRSLVPEKVYIGNATTPQKTYTYAAKKAYLDGNYSSSTPPYYLKVSELTADGKLTVTEQDKSLTNSSGAYGINQKIYDTSRGTEVLLSEMTTTYHNYFDILHPETIITKNYNSSDSNTFTITESEYTYDSYGNALTFETTIDGTSKNKMTNTYFPSGRYYALKTTQISNDDVVDCTTIYTVNIMGEPLTEKTYAGTSSGTLVKDIYYTYDTNNNLIKTEIMDGTDVLASEEYEYSTDGVYLMARRSKDADDNVLLQESYTYDDMGNILSVTNINGTEQFEYDSLNRVTKEIHPDGSSKTIGYYELDRDIAVVDELSRLVHYFYNSMGLPQYIEQWSPESSSFDMYYDTMGNLNRTNDRLGNDTYITHDIFGRQTKVSYPLISGTEEESAEVKYYDVFLDGDSKSSVRIVISQNGKISCEYYDVYGRLYKTALVKNYTDFEASDFDDISSMPTTAQLITTGSYVYDNFDRVVEQYDGENRKSTYTYDVLGNVLTTTTGTGDDALTVAYEYDMAGRCVKMIQGGNHITRYEYNEAGQLVKMTDPMNYTETYTYDTAGNVLTQKDKNGIITTNTYDNRGRVIKTQRSTKSIDYTYDAIGNILTQTDENGTITYEYNADGTLYKKTYPDGKYITYDSYDKDDRVTQFTDYFGNTIQQTYNSRGLVSSISENYSGASAVKTTSYEYNPDGSIKKVNIPNQDIATLYTYDYAGNVTDVRNVNVNNNYAHNRHTYTYDDSGYVLSKNEYIYGTNNAVTYTYDTAGRLVQESRGTNATTVYSYDGYNNLISETGSVNKSYTYDNNNRLIKLQETNAYADTEDVEVLGNWQTDYIYDNNGKLLGASKWNEEYDSTQKGYSYDSWGRLIHFSDGFDISTSYTYYSDGLRKSKTTGNNTQTYYYNGDNIINESVNGANTSSYLMGADGYICRKRGSNYDFYHKDAHGDVVLVFNQVGGRVSSYVSNAWGEEVSWYDFYSGVNQNPIRYAGQYYDTESGMTYLRARYYDSRVKRFISEDPIKDGLNWYAYCGNNPVMFVDPSGLEPGERFDSADAAAEDFARYINQKSIEEGVEYGTYIYSYVTYQSVEGEYGRCEYYSYAEPYTSGLSSNIYYEHPENIEYENNYSFDVVAYAHTHGDVRKNMKDDAINLYIAEDIDVLINIANSTEVFSKEYDIKNAQFLGLPTYLVAPTGKLKVYDPQTNKERVVATGFYYDPFLDGINYFN